MLRYLPVLLSLALTVYCVVDAIQNGTGVLGRMLALTKAAESYDDASFATLATELGYSSHHINMAHMDALVWADSIGL